MNTGRAAAVKLLHARLFLKADAGDRRGCWPDAAIAEALDTRAATVHRGHQAFVVHGLEAAVARKRPTGRQSRTLDGRQEAPRIAVTWSAPPEGRQRWTLTVLADQRVALDIVDRISPECIRAT